MKMKTVLTAEEISQLSFRKMNVEEKLEPEASGENAVNAPAGSSSKRKADTPSQPSKKKKTAKQREEMRTDNFVQMEADSETLPSLNLEQVDETGRTPPHAHPELETTGTSKDRTIHLDSDTTPIPPAGSFRLANLPQLLQSSEQNAEEQSQFLQQVFPAEFRAPLAALAYRPAHNAIVQNGLVFFGMFADYVRRADAMHELLMQREADLSYAHAETEKLREEKKAAKKSEDDMKAVLIGVRKEKQELVGAVGQAKEEAERLQTELDKVRREKDDAVTGRELAEADLAAMRTALPAIAQKVMDSGPVTEKFNAYLDAALEHDRCKVVQEVLKSCDVLPPFPEPVQKYIKEDTAATLLAAEQATQVIEIPTLTLFAADPALPLNQLLDNDL